MRALIVAALFSVLGVASAQTEDDGGAAEAPASETDETIDEASGETTDAATAEPEDPRVSEAREALARGQELYAAENYEAALAEYERVYELLEGHPIRPVALFNIAQCYERLFRYDRALTYYQRYLDEAANEAPDRPIVERLMSALEGLLATVVVRANVDGAEVWIDGRLAGTTPSELRVPGGQLVIEVRADGHLPAQRELQIAARGREEVDVELEPLPEPGESGLSPAFFWSAASVGAAAAIVGAGFGIAALRQRRDLNDKLDDPTRAFEVSRQDINQVERNALIADVLYGVAGAFAATASVFLFVTRWDDDDVSVAPTAGRGEAGVVVRGQF